MENDRKAPAKTAYIVESPLQHDRRFEIGESIDLTDDEARQLIDAKAISRPDHASRDAREAPKQRKAEADTRAAAQAREALTRAEADAEVADQAAKDAVAKAEDAKQRALVARSNAADVAKSTGLPHTWEQDSNALGGDAAGANVGGSVTGKAAEAPAHGQKATSSTPTAEGMKKSK